MPSCSVFCLFFFREQFLKSNAQLTFRCRQLLSELSYIYPIDVVSLSCTDCAEQHVWKLTTQHFLDVNQDLMFVVSFLVPRSYCFNLQYIESLFNGKLLFLFFFFFMKTCLTLRLTNQITSSVEWSCQILRTFKVIKHQRSKTVKGFYLSLWGRINPKLNNSFEATSKKMSRQDRAKISHIG